MTRLESAERELVAILGRYGNVTGGEWYRLLMVSGTKGAALYETGAAWREARGLPRDGWLVDSPTPML